MDARSLLVIIWLVDNSSGMHPFDNESIPEGSSWFSHVQDSRGCWPSQNYFRVEARLKERIVNGKVEFRSCLWDRHADGKPLNHLQSCFLALAISFSKTSGHTSSDAWSCETRYGLLRIRKQMDKIRAKGTAGPVPTENWRGPWIVVLCFDAYDNELDGDYLYNTNCCFRNLAWTRSRGLNILNCYIQNNLHRTWSEANVEIWQKMISADTRMWDDDGQNNSYGHNLLGDGRAHCSHRIPHSARRWENSLEEVDLLYGTCRPCPKWIIVSRGHVSKSASAPT